MSWSPSAYAGRKIWEENMNPFKRVVYLTAVSFTCITYLFMVANNSMELFTGGFKFEAANRVLIFSLVLGRAGLLFDIKKLPGAVARALHFIVLCADFAVVLAPQSYGSDFRMIFLAVLIFAVIYWVIVAVFAVAKMLIGKAKNAVSQEK